MTKYEKLNKLEAENKKLENLLIAFREVINLDDAEDLQTDLFTCFNHAENDHTKELYYIEFLISDLLSTRVQKVKELEQTLNKVKK